MTIRRIENDSLGRYKYRINSKLLSDQAQIIVLVVTIGQLALSGPEQNEARLYWSSEKENSRRLVVKFDNSAIIGRRLVRGYSI